MKKFRIFSHLIVIAILSLLFIQNAEAAGASFSGVGSLRAGSQVTVTLSISGEDIRGIEASLSYDSSKLSYVGYKQVIGNGWDMQVSGSKFVLRDAQASAPINSSTSVVAVTFTVLGDVAVGETVSASFSNILVSDSSFSASYANNASWSAEILPPLSGNADLNDLWCDNAELNFTGSTEYSITVPYEVSSLDLDWDRAHSGSSVSVSGNSLSVGSNTVTVTVEAENGNTKRYYIYVTREQDPNYVPSSDATLSSLSPTTGTLSPAFAADVTDYVLYVPYETTALSINATANDSKAKGVSQLRQVLLPALEVPADEAAPTTDKNAPADGTAADPKPAEPMYRTLETDEPLPEGETIYTVTCTAEDGTTTLDYVVHVIRMPLYAGMLPEIIPPVTGPVEPEPEPEPTTYDISLPLVMTLPYIGEVTLQQAALGAAVALGVILLLLLLLAWLIGRAGGKRKALRKLAEAQRRPDTPQEALLTRLAAQTETQESAPAEAPQAEEAPAEEEAPAAEEEAEEEASAPAEEPAAEEVEETAPEIPAEDEGETAAQEDPADETPPAEPSVEDATGEDPAAEEDPVVEEDPVIEEEAVSAPETPDDAEPAEEGSAAPAEEVPQAETDEAISAMSLEQLLEDIRNM